MDSRVEELSQLDLGFHLLYDWEKRTFERNGENLRYPPSKEILTYHGLTMCFRQSVRRNTDDYCDGWESIEATDCGLKQGEETILHIYFCSRLEILFLPDENGFLVKQSQRDPWISIKQPEVVTRIIQGWMHEPK